MIALIMYHMKMYCKSVKFLLSAALWVLILVLLYDGKANMLPDYLPLLSAFLFILMAIQSYMYTEEENHNKVADMVMILHTRGMNYYNMSKVIFQIVMAAVMSLAGMIFPLLKHLLKAGQFFEMQPTITQVVIYTVSLFLSAFVGVGVGALFHPRVIKDRSFAVFAFLVVLMLSFARDSIIKAVWSGLKYILWIFPPITDLLGCISNMNVNDYDVFGFVLISIWCVIYGLVTMALQCVVLWKNRY